MTKDAYYFSHDANARQDPKILAMMSVYGAEGYGRYWILVEMLREQSDFALDKQGKYTFNALAMQLHCNKDAAEQFVNDCIYEFELFSTDGVKFWSDSLLRRMAIKEELSIKRKKAAEKRWGKKPDGINVSNEEESKDNANVMQLHSTSNANGMQGKEIKENKSKVKEKKVKKELVKYADFVSMSIEEYQKLSDQFGKTGTDDKIQNLNLYKGSTGKTYKDDYLTILSWERKNQKGGGQSGTHTNAPSMAEQYGLNF